MVSLFLLWWQIRQAANWNRLKTHHDLLGYLPDEKLEGAVLAALAQAGLEKDVKIPLDVAKALYRDPDAFVLLKTFLNKFEHFCAAINAGAVNKEYAYRLHWGRVITVYDMYDNFIKVFRSQWSKSPAKYEVGEFFMGHTVDPYEYDKSFRDVAFYQKEYLSALPMFQIISSGSPFGRVNLNEVEGLQTRIRELETELGKRDNALSRVEESLQQVMERLNKLEKSPL